MNILGYKLPVHVAPHVDIVGPSFFFPLSKRPKTVRVNSTSEIRNDVDNDNAQSLMGRHLLSPPSLVSLLEANSNVKSPSIVEAIYSISQDAKGDYGGGNSNTTHAKFVNRQAVFNEDSLTYVSSADLQAYFSSYQVHKIISAQHYHIHLSHRWLSF